MHQPHLHIKFLSLYCANSIVQFYCTRLERVDFTCNREYAENHDTGDANAITDNSICSTNDGASCSSTKEIINTKSKNKLPAVDETIVVAKAKADEAIAGKRNGEL